jgi:hypothetical protein
MTTSETQIIRTIGVGAASVVINNGCIAIATVSEKKTRMDLMWVVIVCITAYRDLTNDIEKCVRIIFIIQIVHSRHNH